MPIVLDQKYNGVSVRCALATAIYSQCFSIPHLKAIRLRNYTLADKIWDAPRSQKVVD